MNELVFEIWRDDVAGQQEMGPVTEQTDKLRSATMPNAVRVHSFKAASTFQAFQINYDWNGWGAWKPEPEWIDQSYTEVEAAEQRGYLAKRDVR